MTHIRTIQEVEKVLARYIPLSRTITGRDITLGRMKILMDAISNPQRSLRIIHVAGTSGKTSTAYYIAALLSQAGYRTGVTVSPHVDSVTERLQINLVPLGESEFGAELEELLGLIPPEIEPTYFELLIALAYWYFAKVGVDYAVVETGMGGLQDGTNVADNPDKLCIITDIGYDHMHILGSSLSEIAEQKAGIIHARNNVLMYRQPDVVIGVVQDRCRVVGAELHFHNQAELEEEFKYPELLDTLPDFQKRNFLLAHQAYIALMERDNLKQLENVDIKAAIKTDVPGRMDKRVIGGKTIIQDGAHNEQKMEALVGSYLKEFGKTKATVLLSLKQGKEHENVLPLLLPITDTLIICGFSSIQDTPLNSIDPARLSEAAKKVGFKNVVLADDANDAYDRLMSTMDKVGIITGSFYLIGILRHNHKELHDAKS